MSSYDIVHHTLIIDKVKTVEYIIASFVFKTKEALARKPELLFKIFEIDFSCLSRESRAYS